MSRKLVLLFLRSLSFPLPSPRRAATVAASRAADSSSSSIRLADPLVFDANGNGLPNYRDVVLFNVSTTATTQPFVNLQCFQNGGLVLNGWNGYFDGALNSTRNFGLSSASWQGGAADCTAYLNTVRAQRALDAAGFHELPRRRLVDRGARTRVETDRGPGFRRGLCPFKTGRSFPRSVRDRHG